MTDNTKNHISNYEFNLNEDTNEIKRLETALKEIKTKFNDAESIGRFGFLELDPFTLDRTWTDGLFKIIGYDPKYGQLRNFDEHKKLIHPEDWDIFMNAIQITTTTGKDVEFNLRVKKPDNSTCIIQVKAEGKKDKNGKVIKVIGIAQDITELKEMENRLKNSETFYKTLFENTGTASIIVDEDTTILMVNTQFEKLSGYSKEEIEGKKSWKEFVSKEDLKTMEKYYYMHRNNVGTPPENYEARLIDKNGKVKVILVNVAMIPGTKRIIASLLDLTQRKMAEETLQNTLKRFYTILENMRASILLVTEENIIEFANHSFCDYFDITELAEELIGLTASETIKKIKNAYKYPDEEICRIQEIVSHWQPVIGEEVHMRGGRTCLRDFIPILVGDKPYGRLWLHLDITERKKMEKKVVDSERRYKYIVEKATAGIFILDKEGIIKYLNENMAQILNYAKKEMLERHIKIFVDEDEDFYRPRKSFETQIERYDWFKFLYNEGKVFWSNLTVSPIFNSKNEYTGLLGIVTDINIQKGLEEAFLEREEIFTGIIYDMMEILNNIAKDKNKSEFN